MAMLPDWWTDKIAFKYPNWLFELNLFCVVNSTPTTLCRKGEQREAPRIQSPTQMMAYHNLKSKAVSCGSLLQVNADATGSAWSPTQNAVLTALRNDALPEGNLEVTNQTIMLETVGIYLTTLASMYYLWFFLKEKERDESCNDNVGYFFFFFFNLLNSFF